MKSKMQNKDHSPRNSRPKAKELKGQVPKGQRVRAKGSGPKGGAKGTKGAKRVKEAKGPNKQKDQRARGQRGTGQRAKRPKGQRTEGQRATGPQRPKGAKGTQGAKQKGPKRQEPRQIKNKERKCSKQARLQGEPLKRQVALGDRILRWHRCLFHAHMAIRMTIATHLECKNEAQTENSTAQKEHGKQAPC